MLTHHRSKRKPTGGRFKKGARKKKKYELARRPAFTKLAERKSKQIRVRSGDIKTLLMTCDIANVLDKKTGKHTKTKILNVIENAANRHYIRANIITKGCVIKTELGNAKVTSRPGQEGTVNAILI